MMKKINRRSFLKVLGIAGAACAMTALTGCEGASGGGMPNMEQCCTRRSVWKYLCTGRELFSISSGQLVEGNKFCNGAKREGRILD